MQNKDAGTGFVRVDYRIILERTSWNEGAFSRSLIRASDIIRHVPRRDVSRASSNVFHADDDELRCLLGILIPAQNG